MLIGKLGKQFYHVKPLKISLHSTKEVTNVKSETSDSTWSFESPLEVLLSALAGCEASTMRGLTHKGDFHVKSVNFLRVESGYDIGHFVKGGPDNAINEVFIDAEVETNGTQQQLDALEEKVKNSCPVYQMLTQAGVKINNNWKNIQTIA